MNYNEQTGDFEKTTCERVGFILGYVGWWAFKIAFLLAVAGVVFKVGQLIWRWICL